eukprot:5945829-Prorocentrum_lima.AAC.1
MCIRDRGEAVAGAAIMGTAPAAPMASARAVPGDWPTKGGGVVVCWGIAAEGRGNGNGGNAATLLEATLLGSAGATFVALDV